LSIWIQDRGWGKAPQSDVVNMAMILITIRQILEGGDKEELLLLEREREKISEIIGEIPSNCTTVSKLAQLPRWLQWCF
jgi:hypothetical protein